MIKKDLDAALQEANAWAKRVYSLHGLATVEAAFTLFRATTFYEGIDVKAVALRDGKVVLTRDPETLEQEFRALNAVARLTGYFRANCPEWHPANKVVPGSGKTLAARPLLGGKEAHILSAWKDVPRASAHGIPPFKKALKRLAYSLALVAVGYALGRISQLF